MTGREEETAASYETARSGTIYWTLSLFIEAEKVAAALGLKPDERVKPDDFRRVQRDHKPSLALANAIDPLMNDIADRETQGEVQEFLLAATAENFPDLRDARAAVRRHEDLKFRVPGSISWSTEGVEFRAEPDGLDQEREVRLRRFWLSHNNGALSYHLSFSHFYGADQTPGRSGYRPATLYFLSLLQKLAAPKEYTLNEAVLERANGLQPPYVDVFDPDKLGIDPLDNITIEHRLGADGDAPARVERFWPFVKSTFEIDAEVLFGRLARACGGSVNLQRDQFADTLLDRVPFIEVPGLAAPKSRFMFMLHDERFFNRLMPLDPVTNETLSRKVMVQPACYEPYEARMNAMMAAASDRDDAAVLLDGPYWKWVCTRPEYAMAVTDGLFVRDNPGFDATRDESIDNARRLPITADSTGARLPDRMKDLVSAMRTGDCFQTAELPDPFHETSGTQRQLNPPARRHIPAFEAGRSDCLEYLFLAGFNQNIIDFMNQDTSEILDSIDPIYPDSEDQSSDRFFVRYANHRAMITYVPKSRSLETGNDYIGACPYAFLIHVLALHNEFLARGHEQKTMTRIDEIETLLAKSKRQEDEATDEGRAKASREEAARLDKAEIAINEAKLAEFSQYERFRYANPFRYETERTVFKTLEELRGISRKKEALALAIKSLEDHASDLSRRQQLKAEGERRAEAQARKDREDEAALKQKRVDDDAARRGVWLNVLLGMTGFFGAGQMFYWIGEKAAGPDAGGPPHPTMLATPLGVRGPSADIGNAILAATEVVMMVTLGIFILMLGYILVDALRQLGDRSRRVGNKAGKPENPPFPEATERRTRKRP